MQGIKLDPQQLEKELERYKVGLYRPGGSKDYQGYQELERWTGVCGMIEKGFSKV